MSEHLAWVVVALQVAVLLALALTPGEPPPRVELFELLWAAARRPTFYPLVALLTAGPILTALALREPGRQRAWLATAWCAFTLIALVAFGPRLVVMIDVLWWYVQQ